MVEQISLVVIGAFVSLVFFVIKDMIARKKSHASPCQPLELLNMKVTEIEKVSDQHARSINATARDVKQIQIDLSGMAAELRNTVKLIANIDGKIDKAIENK